MPRVTPPKRDPRYPDFPTIVHALAYAAEHRGRAPALACLDREITYAQYAQAVAALARRFGEAGVVGERIAYLMRNGLDMAFSSNQNQLYNFGWLFTRTERDPELTPEASLDFWIAANRRAVISAKWRSVTSR